MTIELNPYQAPNSSQMLAATDDAASTPRRRVVTRAGIAIWLLAYLYPVWLLVSFYLTWLSAWVQLGYRPRPMLDDPRSIGGISEIAYYVPGVLLMLMPALMPLGLAASFFCPINTRRESRLAWGAAFSILYIGLCAIALLILRSDPVRVVEWWGD